MCKTVFKIHSSPCVMENETFLNCTSALLRTLQQVMRTEKLVQTESWMMNRISSGQYDEHYEEGGEGERQSTWKEWRTDRRQTGLSTGHTSRQNRVSKGVYVTGAGTFVFQLWCCEKEQQNSSVKAFLKQGQVRSHLLREAACPFITHASTQGVNSSSGTC